MTTAAPIRRARLRRLARQGLAPIAVLFYHRIADSHSNDWTLSREDFMRHIDCCSASAEMIDLAEVQRRVADRDSCSLASSITFDDGYRDNCDFAIPLLIGRGIPCTYFVSVAHIQNQTPFAHDRKQGTHLAVNSVKEIRELSDFGIEIGCHTRHHVNFHRVHDPAVVRNEIIDAKLELEQMIGRRVRYFAFPFGMPAQLTQVAIETIHQAGFDGFCSAYGAYNIAGRDAFHIRRCHGDREFARFENWLSYDPRKVRDEPNVRYFLPPLRSFEETVEQWPVRQDRLAS